jgi:outer membrane assembly lipoprotein YfiO
VQRFIIVAAILGVLLGAAGVASARWVWDGQRYVETEDSEPPVPITKSPPAMSPIPPTPIPAVSPSATATSPAKPATPVTPPTKAATPVPTPNKVTVYEASPAAAQPVQDARWAAAVKAAGPEEIELYNQGRSEIVAGRFESGSKTLGQLIGKFPKSSLREEAMWLRATATLGDGDHFAAFEQLEAFISEYAGSPHYSDALQQEIVIADAFLGGVHRKYLGMTSPLSSESEGLEVLRKVYEHQPRGPLAESVVMKIVDYHWARRHWADAEDYCDKYCREFPNGPSVRRAELMRAKCAIESCRGPRYDTSGLQLAYDRLNQFQKKYPDEARQENVAALMDQVRDMQAQSLYEMAMQYRRAGKLQAAAYYAERLQERFPDSPWTERAAPLLAAKPPKEDQKP